MKKEYYLPLAIIIGTIIIGLSIYLGVTAEYRAKKAICEEQLTAMEDDMFKRSLVMACVSKTYGPNKWKMKKTETKKTETKKPTVGTKKPFWDGRSRASTPGYRENYNSIFKQRRNFRRPSKWWIPYMEK